MCLFRKCQLQGLRSRQKRSLLFVNESILAASVTQQMVLYGQTLNSTKSDYLSLNL
jgi:hypothetical protein